MINKIEKWKNDGSLYIQTRATNYVLACINKHNCVSVIGPSGSGKTFLVRYVALQMEINGYTIFTVTDAKEITDQYKYGRKTLYIVDDMCGNFTANQIRIEEWKKSMNDIKSILENDNCKLILTCRLQVFRDKEFTNLEIFQTCECNLRSYGLSLTSNEKKNLTVMYFKEHALEALKHLGEYDILPLLCRLYYVQKENHHFSLTMFFNDPFSSYEKELHNMYKDCKEGKYKYSALLLLVIFNNKLVKETITGTDPKVKEIINDVMEVCEIYEHITSRKLASQLEILIGTFVTYDEGMYTTIHDKLFDFLAFYFGTQEELISILIKHAKPRFVRERFVVTKDNKCEQHLIPLSDDKLQMYMERIFDDMVRTCDLKTNIVENKNLKNIKLCTMVRDFMRNLKTYEITALFEKASTTFLNVMFVMRETDIKDKVKIRTLKYTRFGIILPDDLLQQYIYRWLGDLTQTNFTMKCLEDNRLLRSNTFRTALNSYMKHMHPHSVASIIRTGNKDFLDTMFVVSEHDIKAFAENQNECVGIVLTEGMVQHYIDRWFDDLSRHANVDTFLDGRRFTMNFSKPTSVYFCQANSKMLDRFIVKNRLLMNVSFRITLSSYLKQLTKSKIALLINTAEDAFLNAMFVMTEDDINENSENPYEWFGIVIPEDLIQDYIETYFDRLTHKNWMVPNIRYNRAFKNDKCCTALRRKMKQITNENIISLIKISVDMFFITMFVMSDEDIKTNVEDGYECFGIVIPDDLLHHYIERWFADLTIRMKTDVPLDEIRSFETSVSPYCVSCSMFFFENANMDKFIDKNRLFRNFSFRFAIRAFMRELTKLKIASLIQSAGDCFLNTMFVVSEDDINDNSKNPNEWFGIVIPDDLIQKYIETYFDRLTNKNWMENNYFRNRALKHIKGCTALRSYMKQLSKEKIASLIQNSVLFFFNRRFVMIDRDIEENNQRFGIVIPEDQLYKYIRRYLDDLTNTSWVKQLIDFNRLMTNAKFICAIRTFLRQLTTKQVALLIQTATVDFINLIFVMTEEDIKDNAKNKYECLGIVIPDDQLQQYIERWFDGLTDRPTRECMKEYIDENRLYKNGTFRNDVRTYIRRLTENKIASIIRTSSDIFINDMFVLNANNTNDNEPQCLGIVISDNLLHHYIERWLECLSKTYRIEEFINTNKPLENVEYCTALKDCLRQLNIEKKDSLIWNSGYVFFQKMFVMTEDDINNNAENRYERFGIVISDELLLHYIERWLKLLPKDIKLHKFINENRPFKNVKFRNALRNYTRQLNTANISSLIWDAKMDFLNEIFIMTDDDIMENTGNSYEGFGIVIPGELLQLYIARWFEFLPRTSDLKKLMNKSRPVKHVAFRIAFREFLRKLNTETIASLIVKASDEFLNLMFVMTGNDIQDNEQNRYECFGIIIPGELLQQYTEGWFKCLTRNQELDEFIDENRPLKHFSFRTGITDYLKDLGTQKKASLISYSSLDFFNKMFVMTNDDIKDKADNRYECFGVVIPEELLQKYIKTLFSYLLAIDEFEKFIDTNRPMKNMTFRTALFNYTRQLTTEAIASLIGFPGNFFSTMFFMSDADVKDNVNTRYECLAIVIPDDFLQQYIEKWFEYLTTKEELENFIDKNRLVMNLKFRTAVRIYTKHLNTEKIVSLIQKGSIHFLNKVFVMPEDEIKDNDENRHEWFRIVIPYDLLLQYIESWFNSIIYANSVKECIDANRSIMNVTFQTSLRSYIRQIDKETIASIIDIANDDFLNTMFAMTEQDIKDNDGNRYEWFGIVIPDDVFLFQQYIKRWFHSVTRSISVMEYMNVNRPLLNGTFRTALRTHIRQLDNEEIRAFIQTGTSDFVNTMFVMTEDAIKDEVGNRYESFGIVIPDEMCVLQQYIKRWFQSVTEAISVKEYMKANRSLTNVTFRTALRTFMSLLDTEEIGPLIRTGSSDFLNTMFVLTEDDINENAVNLYERFGIVIPDEMLQQYIERWFLHLFDRPQTKSFLDGNRLLMNATFCTAFRNFIKQLNREQIAYFIQKGSKDFINTMFVMTEDDIKDDGANRYEWFGIVIPDDLLLLQQYIERWFKSVTEANSVKVYMNANRLLTNATFRTALHTYMSLLDTDEIESLIRTGSSDFLNTMFVLMENDIVSEHAYYRFESFGIVIPDDMLQKYIERWMDCMKKTNSVMEFVGVNRSSMSNILQTELEPYMTEVNSEK